MKTVEALLGQFKGNVMKGLFSKVWADYREPTSDTVVPGASYRGGALTILRPEGVRGYGVGNRCLDLTLLSPSFFAQTLHQLRTEEARG